MMLIFPQKMLEGQASEEFVSLKFCHKTLRPWHLENDRLCSDLQLLSRQRRTLCSIPVQYTGGLLRALERRVRLLRAAGQLDHRREFPQHAIKAFLE
jgi:hypothetical protein